MSLEEVDPVQYVRLSTLLKYAQQEGKSIWYNFQDHKGSPKYVSCERKVARRINPKGFHAKMEELGYIHQRTSIPDVGYYYKKKAPPV